MPGVVEEATSRWLSAAAAAAAASRAEPLAKIIVRANAETVEASRRDEMRDYRVRLVEIE